MTAQWHEVFGNDVTAQEIVDDFNANAPDERLMDWLQAQYIELYPGQEIPDWYDFYGWADAIHNEAKSEYNRESNQ